MADHYVEIDPFDPASIKEANKELKRLAKEFDRNVDQFIVEFAEIGQRAAQGRYGSAIDVTVERIENGVRILASGKAIIFLEFGAGTTVNTANRYKGEVEAQGGFGIYPGSWSEEHAREFLEKGYWTFGGVKYTHIDPRNGMQGAYDAMMQDMQALITKVFG